MSTLGFYTDAPGKISSEGREITLKLQKTSPSTAKVSWTLPKGAPGCSIDDLTYNGILVVTDTVPIKQEQTPTNQKYYTGDPTVDRNLHAGSKIGTGLVIGAFYDDKTTTSLDISGLQLNTPYYITGFAVDNVGTYDLEGAHSYSQDYQENPHDPDTAGCQTIKLGVLSSDSTGLVSTNTYTFNVSVDYPGFDNMDLNSVYDQFDGFNDGFLNTLNQSTLLSQIFKGPLISISGSQAQTYQQLIDLINFNLSILNNPFQGPNAPGTGTIYVNQLTNEAYIWNGTLNVLQNTLTSISDPTSPTVNDFWLNSTTQTMSKWNGTSWVLQKSINFASDPSVPECGTYWFNGTTCFQWDGTIWKPQITINQISDPSSAPVLPCGMFWLNLTTNQMFQWITSNGSCQNGELTEGIWTQVNVLDWNEDPRTILDGVYWFNTSVNKLQVRNVNTWSAPSYQVVVSDVTPPSSYVISTLWVNTSTDTLYEWDGVNWVISSNEMIVWATDPTTPSAGELLWNDNLFVWDQVNQQWKLVNNFVESSLDPSEKVVIEKNVCWNDGTTLRCWDGMQWVVISAILFANDPTTISDGILWNNTLTNSWSIHQSGSWVIIPYAEFNIPPTSILPGQYWYNPQLNSLYVWNGIAWISLIFQIQPVSYSTGSLWYNTTEKSLYSWNGSSWVVASVPRVSLNELGNLVFTSGTTGSKSTIIVTDGISPNGLFANLIPRGAINPPTRGTDGLLPTPSYLQQGVGTDGTSEERREMIETILIQFGYPIVQVELTKEHLNFCVDQGLQTLRRMGSSGYERAFFFMDMKAGQQTYKLTDKTVGFHKIVNIMGIYRMTAAILGSAEGQGVYGQLVLQHLYQMGTFDLVSYHIINEYTELMEKLFAANIMYTWREKPRLLSIHQNLFRDERVLMDVMIERTEQDIMTDRFLNNWIQTWATGEACLILAEIRGKFGNLPGAGGGVTLNAVDLRARAEKEFQQCIDELDNYIANSNFEDIGLGSQIIMG
jgi:hypothetical protein